MGDGKVENRAFTLISFLTCARDGVGQASSDDRRLITVAHVVLCPLPPGVYTAIDAIGFFQLLAGCNFDLVAAFVAYCRSDEIYWPRAKRDGQLPDPYFLYDFETGTPVGLPEYVRNIRRLREGPDSETISKTYPAVGPYIRSERVKTTWARAQAVYDEYLARRAEQERLDEERRRLDNTPDDPDDPPPIDTDDDPPLDDDWGLEDLNINAPLNDECVPLYKEIHELRAA